MTRYNVDGSLIPGMYSFLSSSSRDILLRSFATLITIHSCALLEETTLRLWSLTMLSAG